LCEAVTCAEFSNKHIWAHFSHNFREVLLAFMVQGFTLADGPKGHLMQGCCMQLVSLFLKVGV